MGMGKAAGLLEQSTDNPRVVIAAAQGWRKVVQETWRRRAKQVAWWTYCVPEPHTASTALGKVSQPEQWQSNLSPCMLCCRTSLWTTHPLILQLNQPQEGGHTTPSDKDHVSQIGADTHDLQLLAAKEKHGGGATGDRHCLFDL